MLLLVAPMSVGWVACSFPENEFNDEKYEKLKNGGSTAGTSSTGGAGGTTTGGNGGTTTGGKAQGGGTAGSTTGGSGGDPAGGSGGSGGDPAGGSGGTGGDPAGGSGGTTTGGTGGTTTGGTGGTTTGGSAGTTTGGSAGTTSGGSAGTAGSGGGGVMNGPCTGNSQCINGQVCSSINLSTEKISCQSPNGSAAGELGTACTSNAMCKSKYCDLLLSKTCLQACNAVSDCTAGSICVEVGYSQMFRPNICMKPCTKNEDCPANAGGTKTCMLHQDNLNDDLAFSCDYIGATPMQDPTVKTFPQEMVTGDFCDTNVNLQTTQSGVTKSYCSKTCATAADCGGVLPNCKAIQATKPISMGTTAFQACTP